MIIFHLYNYIPPSIHFILFLAKLDPFRPSRKFSEPKPLEDEADAELREKKAARAERLNVLSEETLDEIALEKKAAQREAARQLEENYLIICLSASYKFNSIPLPFE